LGPALGIAMNTASTIWSVRTARCERRLSVVPVAVAAAVFEVVTGVAADIMVSSGKRSVVLSER
jgi:hypothetical protein